jgi:hypothetical protein
VSVRRPLPAPCNDAIPRDTNAASFRSAPISTETHLPTVIGSSHAAATGRFCGSAWRLASDTGSRIT